MDEPSDQLVKLLERLRLATAGQVRSQRAQVRRLAGELAAFDSVWTDALAQARLLTPYQAHQINAGRGEQLQVGPYVLLRPQGSLGYADCFAARHLESGEIVRLYVVGKMHPDRAAAQRQLADLIDRSAALASEHLLPIRSSGIDDGRLWAATPPCSGRSAADWMVENGRFPAELVLPIAQTMTAALVELAERSIVHGDISAASLLMDEGRLLFAHPGLRGVVRPAEGYAYHELPPAAYDYLAPERIAAGTPPTVAGDLYACGVVWWHLLAGRPPFAGGNSLAKLRSVHAARAADVRQLAPDAPPRLTEAIACCLAADPDSRPADFRSLAELLGLPPRGTSARLARLMSERKRSRALPGAHALEPGRTARTARRSLAAVAVVVLITLVCWPAWRKGDLLPRWSLGRSKPPQARTTIADSRQRPPATQRASTSPAGDRTPSDRSGGEKSATPVAYWTEEQVPPLVLPADRTLVLERLSLRPGQVVRGQLGTRPKVVVPARGLSVAVEDVTFENIDFTGPPAEGSPAATSSGLIAVSAARVQFQNCTFRGGTSSGAQRSAIVWRGPARSRPGTTATGRQLTLRNCVVAELASAIDVTGAPRFSIALANSLFANCGSVLRLRGAAQQEGSGELLLEHVTARETGPVVLVESAPAAGAAGVLAIAAVESTFAPRSGVPLLVIGSENPGDEQLEWLQWQGQGSLLAGEAPVAAWQTPDGQLTPLADEQLSVAGLVRSSVQFAGKSATDSAASRAARWQVPLQSDEPPGIGDDLP